MIDGDIKLRLLEDTESDYKLLAKWYQEEEIYTHFEQRRLTYDEIVDKYRSRTFENSKMPVYMIEYKDRPVGIVQYKLVNDDDKKLYKIASDKCYEIDIFIGELELYNRGIGRRSINIITNYLFKEKQAQILVMWPLANNLNAIKCYTNCGFTIKSEFYTEDTIGNLQNYVLMVKQK